MDRRVILLLSCTVLLQSFSGLQLALGQSPFEPHPTGNFTIGNRARVTMGDVPAGAGLNLTAVLVSGNASYLAMVNRYNSANVNNPGPFCYLEVLPRFFTQNVSSATTDHWTKPCPRTAQQVSPVSGFWCEFEFSAAGSLILRSGGANGTSSENGTVLWSSNTTGLDVQRLGMVDVSDGGNLMLYNSSEVVVWRNIRDNPVGEAFNCSDAVPAASPVGAPSNRKLLHHI